jgi:Protein of unknown function (DUF3179)
MWRIRVAALIAFAPLVLAACSAGIQRSGPPASRATTGPPPLIDPDRIIAGGPPPDGIPPIDHPRFLPVNAVRFLAPQEPVLAVTVRGRARAYPLRIMMWHEIVNDVVGGVPVTVTYCPLCNTAVAFRRPVIGGRLLDFGTSGKLYDSNLLMYDRQTRSYWSQALGKAVVGKLTGTKLDLLPALIVSWEDWRADSPDGLVLSTDTGFERDYGTNPYVRYVHHDVPFLFDGHVDPRLPATEYVLGVASGVATEAFPFSELRRAAVDDLAVASDRVGDTQIVVFWERGTVSALDAPEIPDSEVVGAAVAFRPTLDGRTLSFSVGPAGITDDQTSSRWNGEGVAIAGPLAGRRLEPVVALNSFWFDWAAFYPQTRIFRSE